MMSPSRSFALFACLVAATVVGCGPRRVSSPVADAAAAVTIREGLASTTAVAVGGGEAAATGTGWAGLKGRFVFAGDPGQPKALAVDKDTEVCGKSSKLFDRSLRVDASGKGLADVVVFVRKSSRG
jgi:hypothetical protein